MKLDDAPAIADADAIAEAARLFALQRAASRAAPFADLATRRDRLQRLLRLVQANRDDFAAAISADFGHRSTVETLAFEALTGTEEIRHALGHVKRWMRPQRRAGARTTWPARASVVPQPLGTVGVIVPWNYPLFLAVSPLVGALAAGNRALVKTSEHTPRFGALFAERVARLFAEDEVRAVGGGVAAAQAFAALPFDHLLFTGSTAVGRDVMRAAAANLTPVTLELGGKSPAIVAADADLDRAAASIVFGKLVNAGQTCIAPDHVLVPRGREAEFVAAAKRAVLRQLPTLAGNADWTSIVNDRQAARLQALVDDARDRGATVHPLHAETAPDGRRMPPVALTGVDAGMRVMQDEIFGPLLPVLGYDRIGDAIAHVNAGERPLALYLFSHDRATVDAVLERTVSGGVVVGDVLLHVAQHGLPFGGVGASGIGHYHGRDGFETFSKMKPVVRQRRINGGALLRPPYANGRLRKLAQFLIGR